ncbi:hypothetical protein GOBAR_DD28465 [Gossypium barbadense]|nr:hypothetical protein GOBAR_DD28465 [Gossypium barbadense]
MKHKIQEIKQAHDQLRDIEAFNIVELIDSGELETDIIKSDNLTQRSEVNGIYDAMTSVEFVFILHFMIEMLGIIDELCKALQYKSQDILNVMQLKWIRFNDEVVELLVFSSALVPRDNYKDFRAEDICKLMNDFYLNDFTEQEKLHMKIQLDHFQLDAYQSTELQIASTIVELCQVLAKTNKSSIYPFLDRIIHLVPIERAFSAMKIMTTRLHNIMEDDFLSTFLVGHIEKEIAQEFSADSIIGEFYLMKKQRVQFRIPSIEKYD